ncbi:MAG: DUF512 domain-containing protein [Eubacterium sp.]
MKVFSVVPVGLTKFRDGLYPLEPFTKEDAKEVLEMIHKWQKICYEKHGTHFVQASDEWYLLAEEPFPPEDTIVMDMSPAGNGVGMHLHCWRASLDACLELEQEEWREKKTCFSQNAPAEPKVFKCLAERKNRWLLREHLGIAVLYPLLPENQRQSLMRKLCSKVYLPASGYQSQCISDSK